MKKDKSEKTTIKPIRFILWNLTGLLKTRSRKLVLNMKVFCLILLMLILQCKHEPLCPDSIQSISNIYYLFICDCMCVGALEVQKVELELQEVVSCLM